MDDWIGEWRSWAACRLHSPRCRLGTSSLVAPPVSWLMPDQQTDEETCRWHCRIPWCLLWILCSAFCCRPGDITIQWLQRSRSSWRESSPLTGLYCRRCELVFVGQFMLAQCNKLGTNAVRSCMVWYLRWGGQHLQEAWQWVDGQATLSVHSFCRWWHLGRQEAVGRVSVYRCFLANSVVD